MSGHPIIAFDYDFSPFGRKVRTILAASDLSFSRSDQPLVLPRPILQKLDIEYRRIPLLAIGKDVYADTARIVDELQTQHGKLARSPADKAYEQFGFTVFNTALSTVPSAAITPEFKKDRSTVYHTLVRPDIEELRPSGLAAMKTLYQTVERDFLSGPSGFVGGADQFSLADAHLGWILQWALTDIGLGNEAGFGKEDLPRIYKWFETFPKAEYQDMKQEDVWETILNASYSAESIGVDEKDPSGMKEGTSVTVESMDATPGAHPQAGKLVGLNEKEIVLQLKNGIRLHFPRLGYVLKLAKAEGMGSRFT